MGLSSLAVLFLAIVMGIGGLAAGGAWGQGSMEGKEGLAVVRRVEEGIKELDGYPNGTMEDYWRRAWCSAPMEAMAAGLGKTEPGSGGGESGGETACSRPRRSLLG